MIITIYGKIGLMEKNYRILLSDAIKDKEKKWNRLIWRNSL